MASTPSPSAPAGGDHHSFDAASAAARSEPRPRILVVDDEPTVGDVLSRYLARAGFEPIVAADGETALTLAAEQSPAVVVLDLMLPGIGGLDVLRRLAEQPDGPLVILLTARGEEGDRIAGLRAGADDYVVKPFSPSELVARVEAVLRRRVGATAGPAPAIRHGELTIEPSARRVLRGDDELPVTQREFDLLLFLARHPGQAFSREQLMDAVWGYSFYTDTSTVTVHVRRLRAKLEPDPAAPRYVQTVWGIGYRFQP